MNASIILSDFQSTYTGSQKGWFNLKKNSKGVRGIGVLEMNKKEEYIKFILYNTFQIIVIKNHGYIKR